jgi:hypothetical protein
MARSLVVAVIYFCTAAAVANEVLIFEDKFDTFDLRSWKHDQTLSGGG